MATSILVRARRALGLGGNFKHGEIKNDAFFEALVRCSARPGIHTILEIGSSTGDGSTQALLNGLRGNPSQPKLFCIEVLKDRFAELQKRVAGIPGVFCYNVASVPLEQVASEALVRRFAQLMPATTPAETLLQWRAGELAYIAANSVQTSGIARIKKEHGIEHFDLVLIDGSEFTGHAELDAVYGAKIIALDDVRVMKNHLNLLRLAYDPAYTLVETNTRLRNGYAVFQRV